MSAARAVAVALPAEPSAFAEAAHRIAAAGFSHVEVTALVERPQEHLTALADTGLFVACASLGSGLRAADVQTRRQHLQRQKRQVADAAQLGAVLVSLTPPPGEGSDVLSCFTEGCDLLAAFASSWMVRLAVLPVAGTCLPDAESALAWLAEREGIDLGLIDPSAEAVRQAGRQLAYVRAGRTWPDEQALREIGFRGVVVLPEITAGERGAPSSRADQRSRR